MHFIDWTIVVAYVLAVTGLGIWFGRREKAEDIKDYFLGGHSIPWWAALLSLIATEISAATFLGAPEQGYTRDLTYLQFAVGTILARIAIAYLFIGLYYRFQVYTVYGFLAARFGVATNTITASVFLLGRFFADGSRLFIASLAVHVATGLDLKFSIVALAVAAIMYTLFGGIKGVIWTEVIQASVLIGGAVILVFSLLSSIALPFGEVISTIASADKFRLFDLRMDVPAEAVKANLEAGWWLTSVVGAGMAERLYAFAPFVNAYHALPAIAGGFFLTMATHGTDQDMVQRLLTCKDSADGKRSLWMSGFIGVAITGVFLFIGQLMFVLVTKQPTGEFATIAATLKAEGHTNQLVLHYIVHFLPVGLVGAVLASLIAAALSSLGSGLNATSSTLITDLYQRFIKPSAEPIHYVRAGQVSTVAVGILAITIALSVAYFAEAHPEVKLLDIALGVMTFFYGGLLGIFLLAVLTKTRGNSTTNAIAVVLSILAVVGLKYLTPIAWPYGIIVGTVVTFAVAALGKTPPELVASYAVTESGEGPN